MDAWWRWGNVVTDAVLAGNGGPAVIERLGKDRLRRLVQWARRASPYYAERYAHLPQNRPVRLADLPPVARGELMARFDDWVTDRDVTLERVQQFVADPRHVGHPFRDRYAVFSSSGVPGLFVQDADALAVYDALGTARMGALAPLWDWRTPVGGHRFALVAATGGHFAGVVMWERLRALHPWFAKHGTVIPVTEPLDDIVRALEAFRPTVLATYSTVLRALAERKEAGELLCSPRTLWYGGEWMGPDCRRHVERAFQARVAGDYGASEFLNIAFECEKGELHVNSDWAILEPVDEHGRPVPPGQPSATVLLTNLANRVQPFIRYELGDSVTLVPGICGCARPFPRIRVDGRRDEILRLLDGEGRRIAVMPLALSTAIEAGTGVHRFQVEQTGLRKLHVRVEGGGAQAISRVRRTLSDWLAGQGLPGIAITAQAGRLSAHPVSGKFRQVFRRT
jgi:hypothetical protein